LRDLKVPRYLWCSRTGKSFVGSKSSNPIELLTEEKGEAKLSLSLLGFREAEQLIKSNICPLTKYWAKVGAKTNGINYHYRENLLADLEGEGWNVILEQPEPKSEKSKLAWQERRKIQDDSQKDEVKLICQAPDLTHSEAQKIERSPTRTRTQSAAFAKHQIKQRYGVESVSCELVEAAERQKLYPALRLRFWLTVGRGYLEDSDRTLVEKQKESNHGSLFLPDLNNSCSITKVKFLELLDSKVNFLERINQLGGEWSNKSPLLIELKNFVLKDLVRCNQVLRCGIAKTDSPITVAQKILKVIGMKLPSLRNERDGKKRLRIYGAGISKFGELHHLENQILDNWLKAASALKNANAKKPI
jgi:hypothetical protein